MFYVLYVYEISIIARSFNLKDGTHVILFTDLFVGKCFVRITFICADSTSWLGLKTYLLGSKGPWTVLVSLSFVFSVLISIKNV